MQSLWVSKENEGPFTKPELRRTLAATLKSNPNGSRNCYHGANVEDNMPNVFGADTLCNMIGVNGCT